MGSEYAAFYSVVDSGLFVFFSVFSLLSMQRVALGGSWEIFYSILQAEEWEEVVEERVSVRNPNFN